MCVNYDQFFKKPEDEEEEASQLLEKKDKQDLSRKSNWILEKEEI